MKLADSDTGRWEVVTKSGSRHLLDLDARTITRMTEANHLRRDDDAVSLTELVTCEVGYGGVWVLDVRRDGVETFRWTTPIKSIKASA